MAHPNKGLGPGERAGVASQLRMQLAHQARTSDNYLAALTSPFSAIGAQASPIASVGATIAPQ